MKTENQTDAFDILDSDIVFKVMQDQDEQDFIDEMEYHAQSLMDTVKGYKDLLTRKRILKDKEIE